MRINVTKILMALDGRKPIQGLDGEIKPKAGETSTEYVGRATIDLSFRTVAVEALLTPGERQSGVDKLKRYILAERIHLKDVVLLTNDEIKLLQIASEEHSNALVHGRMIEILDPDQYKKLHVESGDETEREESTTHKGRMTSR